MRGAFFFVEGMLSFYPSEFDLRGPPEQLLRLQEGAPQDQKGAVPTQDVRDASCHNGALADVDAARRRVRSRPMKTLLKLALAGALQPRRLT